MNSTGIRSLLILQGLFLVVGWFAIVASQSIVLSDDRYETLIEGLSVAVAFIAFGAAGVVRARIKRTMRDAESALESENPNASRAA